VSGFTEQSPSQEANSSSSSKEIPRLLSNKKFHYHIHKSLSLDPFPSQKNPVHTHRFFPSGFPTKILYAFLICHMLLPSHSNFQISCLFFIAFVVQRLRPSPRFRVSFRNVLILYGEGLLVSPPNLSAGGPPLVSCPRALIHYTVSYSLYLDLRGRN